MRFFKRVIWFIKTDVKLRTETCWYGREEKIDGFRFLVKQPFSRSYQWHSTVGLENTYTLLSLIQDYIKEKCRAAIIEIDSSFGKEMIIIWRGSFKKAEQELFGMIKKLQCQY